LLEVCLYDPSVATAEPLGLVGWRLTENGDGVWRRPRAIAVQPEWEQIFFIQGHTRDSEQIAVLLLADLPPGSIKKTFDHIGKEHGRIGALDVSCDGMHLCYDGDGVVYVVGTDGVGTRRVSPETMTSGCARFLGDGSRLAFIADGSLCVTDLGSETFDKLGAGEFHVDAFEWV
jgi:hypothetical protein